MKKLTFGKMKKYKHFYGNGGFYNDRWFHWNREFYVEYGDFGYLVELHKGNGNQNFNIRILKKMIRGELKKNPNLTENEFCSLINQICYEK